MRGFVEKTFGLSFQLFCPRTLFNPKNQLCLDILPPKGSDPKIDVIFNNPLGKYAFPYFSVMFNFGHQRTAGVSANFANS